MYKGILDWLDYDQRMEIAREHGVTSRQQVHNIVTGKCKNFKLIEALTEKAEANKKLSERANELSNAPA